MIYGYKSPNLFPYMLLFLTFEAICVQCIKIKAAQDQLALCSITYENPYFGNVPYRKRGYQRH